MAAAIPFVSAAANVIGALVGAKTLLSGKSGVAPTVAPLQPEELAPKAMPSADTAALAAIEAKKRAAAAAGKGRMSTILSQSDDASGTLGG